MKLWYGIEDVCTVDLEQALGRPWMWNVVLLHVEEEYQGLGLARALMNIVCRDADRQGVELWLVPQPLLKTREADLKRFYNSLGFYGQDGGYFIRKPQKVPAEAEN